MQKPSGSGGLFFFAEDRTGNFPGGTERDVIGSPGRCRRARIRGPAEIFRTRRLHHRRDLPAVYARPPRSQPPCGRRRRPARGEVFPPQAELLDRHRPPGTRRSAPGAAASRSPTGVGVQDLGDPHEVVRAAQGILEEVPFHQADSPSAPFSRRIFRATRSVAGVSKTVISAPGRRRTTRRRTSRPTAEVEDAIPGRSGIRRPWPPPARGRFPPSPDEVLLPVPLRTPRGSAPPGPWRKGGPTLPTRRGGGGG